MITSAKMTLFDIMITNKQTNKRTNKQTNKQKIYCKDECSFIVMTTMITSAKMT